MQCNQYSGGVVPVVMVRELPRGTANRLSPSKSSNNKDFFEYLKLEFFKFSFLKFSRGKVINGRGSGDSLIPPRQKNIPEIFAHLVDQPSNHRVNGRSLTFNIRLTSITAKCTKTIVTQCMLCICSSSLQTPLIW